MILWLARNELSRGHTFAVAEECENPHCGEILKFEVDIYIARLYYFILIK